MSDVPPVALALACAAVLIVAGCMGSYHDLERSRQALEECRAEHPDDPEACRDEAIAVEQDYERYEREAQQAWRCEKTPDGCTPGKPPAP